MKRTINKKYILISVVYLILCCQLSIQGQKMHIPDQPFEEFQLTTDRDLYIAGESIWIAIHCSAKQTSDDISLSKIIYVELFDANQKVINHGKFSYSNGCSTAHILIPQEQPSGIYFIRAYTQYLKNFNPAIYPLKIITVINPSIPLTKNVDQPENSLKYYPVGGKLVSGLLSQVAVHVPGEIMKEISSLSLHNQDTVIIPKIELFDNGLGSFEFTPQHSENYYLQTNLSGGDPIVTAIKDIQENGYLTQIEDQGDQLVYKMLNSVTNPLVKNKKYHVIVSSDQFSTLYRDSVNVNSPIIEFRINKVNLNSGINYFLLRDEQGNLLALNLYYNTPHAPVECSIKTDKKKYQRREKVNLEITMPEHSEEAMATVSIAVVKKGTVDEITELLPSWLIDQPFLIQPETVSRSKNHQGSIITDEYNIDVVPIRIKE